MNRISFLVLFLLCFSGPDFASSEKKGSMQIQSADFKEGAPIPIKYTSDGENISPELSWDNVPTGVKSFALIVDDPDAPRAEPWVHWILYNIPGNLNVLMEGDLIGTFGKNSWGRAEYGGPQPPRGSGVHHYRFTLYSLSEDLNARQGLTKGELIEAMQGKIGAQAVLVGTYEKK